MKWLWDVKSSHIYYWVDELHLVSGDSQHIILDGIHLIARALCSSLLFLYVMWLAFEGCSWTLLALIIVSIRAMSSHHIERRTGS